MRITDAVPGLAVKATGQAVCAVVFPDGVPGQPGRAEQAGLHRDRRRRRREKHVLRIWLARVTGASGTSSSPAWTAWRASPLPSPPRSRLRSCGRARPPHPQPAAARTASATTSPPASSRASSRPPTRRRLPWQGYDKPGEQGNSKSFARLGVQAHARSMLGSAPWRRGVRGRGRLLGGPGIPRALGATYGQVIGRRSRSGPRRWLRARASRRSRRRPRGRRRGSRRR